MNVTPNVNTVPFPPVTLTDDRAGYVASMAARLGKSPEQLLAEVVAAPLTADEVGLLVQLRVDELHDQAAAEARS